MKDVENLHIEYLKKLAVTLPESPGVYQYYNEDGTILYVGKAKNLKKRVMSYFTKQHDIGKIRLLVRKIREIRHIVVETEADALLLENNLIKKYQPRYNVMLKDDKSYPWICVKNESFPRVFSTRQIIKDGSRYFGPYTSGKMVRTLLDLIKKLYKLRTCKLNLSKKNIETEKFKVCLEFHIKNCKAPCIAKQSEEDYNLNIEQIKKILAGNIKSVLHWLKERMMQKADNYLFEEANEIKEQIALLENYQSKSTIVNATLNNIDVFSIIDDEKEAFVNFLKIVDGAIIQAHTIEIEKRIEESLDDVFPLAISEIRQRFDSTSTEIIVPFIPDYKLDGVNFIVPIRGDKKKLLELSEKNVKYFRLDKIKQKEQIDPERHTNRILQNLQKDLRLVEMPRHIECFDNSNLQGKFPVAACVVFKNARPAKKEYRHFNIKTVEGINDFASMEEVVPRRYKRLLDENAPLPQLVIVDGGKGQLSAAMAAFEKLEIRGKIALIGIAKRLEEIYYPDDPYPLYLDKNSESLKLIQNLRNEAHRFGITFHRQKRSSNFAKSELENIEGIGTKTVEALYNEFKTIKKIKTVTANQLEELVGKAKAKILLAYFENNI